VRARIVTAQGHASRVAALTGAGRYRDAKAEVDLLLVEAGTIGHAPLLAEAEYLHAEVLHRLAEHEPASAAYLRAIELAEPDDSTSARAWLGLVFATGHSLAKYELADEYVRHADAAVQRIGSPAVLAAELLSHRGTIAHDQGDYDEAQALFERALAMREAEGVPPGTTRVNLGRTQAALGQIAVARATVQDAIGQLETRYGATHPIVAKTLTYLGSIEFDAGEYATAKSYYQRSLAIQEQALGPRHPETAFSLNNIANAYMAERDLDQSLVYYERARDILRERLGADHPDIARLTFNMAELEKQLQHWDRAKDEYRAAIGIFERAFGSDHPDVGRGLNNLASVQFDIGEYEESLRNYTESLRVVELALGKEHPGLAYPLVGVGQVHLETGRPDLALAPLERALVLRAADDVDPVDRGDVQLALARALWDASKDRVRARELATAAIASFDRAEPGYPTARDKAVLWLASRAG
jgi:tetratricopeptide (TPR) repeat protein